MNDLINKLTQVNIDSVTAERIASEYFKLQWAFYWSTLPIIFIFVVLLIIYTIRIIND